MVFFFTNSDLSDHLCSFLCNIFYYDTFSICFEIFLQEMSLLPTVEVDVERDIQSMRTGHEIATLLSL